MSQAVPAATFLTYDKFYIYKALAFFFRQKSGKFRTQKSQRSMPVLFSARADSMVFCVGIPEPLSRSYELRPRFFGRAEFAEVRKTRRPFHNAGGFYDSSCGYSRTSGAIIRTSSASFVLRGPLGPSSGNPSSNKRTLARGGACIRHVPPSFFWPFPFRIRNLFANFAFCNNKTNEHISISAMYRTHTCGCLRACNVNETVTLAGWVQKISPRRGLLGGPRMGHPGRR